MTSAELVVAKQRVWPVRGLVLSRLRRGAPMDLTDLKRWIHVNASVFKAEKIDVYLLEPRDGVWDALAELSERLDIPLSLRVNASAPPEAFGPLDSMRPLDLFLTPAEHDGPYLAAWMEAAKAAQWPVRLQLQAPFGPGFDPESVAAGLARDPVVSVNVALDDPFLVKTLCSGADESRAVVAQLNALAAAFAARGIESNLLYLPFCHVTSENLARTENERQFNRDHRQYQSLAFDLAVKLYEISPNAAARAIVTYLGRNASATAFLDDKLLPLVFGTTWPFLITMVLRKFTNRIRKLRGHPQALEESVEVCERKAARFQRQIARRLGPLCSRCRFRRICDGASESFRRVLPGLDVSPVGGELVVDPLYFGVEQPKFYDRIDARRIQSSGRQEELAKQAMERIANMPPTREVDSFDYKVEGQLTHQMAGGNRWFGLANTEKTSTVLTRALPPLTISVMFGGGIADYIGFSFGRHSKIVCPMETFIHRLVLHIDADGDYVLLRDGVPVRPIDFEGVQYVPRRLPGMLEPRISIFNIDASIVTQAVLLWEGALEATRNLERIRHSVLIVSTRYTRRLQAVLLSIAHQQGVSLEDIEVIVCYVPGLDATDDLLDSITRSFPALRIVRCPFREAYARSKGFMINEAARLACGKWLMLLDSDTILPPNMFASIDQVPGSAHFVASDGRVMLTPEITARVLLGELRPWEQWDELIRDWTRLRLREADGVPIGFCQCVRTTCLDKVQYIEMDHFEGADWAFGYGIREQFGREVRLTGVPVLHLDHGGSQWYGAQRHF